MNEIRIPLDQYAYINVQFKGTPEETLAEYRRIIALSKAPVEPKIPLNSGLKPVELLRLLYKPLCGQGLTEDELETLGTEKAYSQQDILKIVQSLINKSKRDEKEITIS